MPDGREKQRVVAAAAEAAAAAAVLLLLLSSMTTKVREPSGRLQVDALHVLGLGLAVNAHTWRCVSVLLTLSHMANANCEVQNIHEPSCLKRAPSWAF